MGDSNIILPYVEDEDDDDDDVDDDDVGGGILLLIISIYLSPFFQIVTCADIYIYISMDV